MISPSWLILLPWLALTAHTAVNATLLRRLPKSTEPDIYDMVDESPGDVPPPGAGERSGVSEQSGWGEQSGRGEQSGGADRSGSLVTERIAVLLPLRNEADRVRPCLEALLAQRGVADLTIHVLDDGSTDGTAEVVREIAGDRVRLITGADLPPGWLGKPYACHQLAQAAGNADILSFVDADVVLEPDALARAATLLRRIGVTLLSPYPGIVGAGALVQPLLQWSWLTFLPLRAMERSPRPSLAAAGGQWLIVDAEGYRRSGGHAGVRTEILEDIELARAVKRSGGRIALADGSPAATCRMYDSWHDLTNGYTKSLWASFGSPVAAGFVVVLLLLLYALPPAAALGLAVTGAHVGALLALCAYLLGVLGRVVAAAATGTKPWPSALAHPIAIVVFAWLIARSFRLRHRGRLFWRGRRL
ncbi:glycosyltransferase [Paractinoplanes ferrugineus]|uniref:Glycosyl transferase n=1 Tax=Paractinoplanes ferrugineus TaxID=113564 RepID=A0A919J5G2_9ACTN|nr:glycosyl transferase [Actinoplanes ferrugineus]